jgi:uncharacterized protein
MLIDAGGEPADEDEWLGCDLHLGADAIIHVVEPTPTPLGQFACAGSYAEVVTPGVGTTRRSGSH